MSNAQGGTILLEAKNTYDEARVPAADALLKWLQSPLGGEAMRRWTLGCRGREMKAGAVQVPGAGDYLQGGYHTYPVPGRGFDIELEGVKEKNRSKLDLFIFRFDRLSSDLCIF